MKKRTVVHILNAQTFAGVEEVVVTLCRHLDPERYHPHLITLFDSPTAHYLRELGFDVDIVPMASRWDLKVVHRIQEVCRRVNADIVHAHTIRSQLFGALAVRRLPIPLVVHIHSPAIAESERKLKNMWNAFVESRLKKWTTCYVTVADSLRSHLRKKGIPESKIVTLHNAIDVDRVIQASNDMDPPIHQQLDLRHDYKLIGMVALFRYRKGAEDLLQAVKMIGKGPVPYRVVMIGEGEKLPGGGTYMDVLTQLTEELEINHRVIYLGFKRNRLQWMKGLDVFVLPSRFGEGLPMVVLESMALQVPVIATPVEGTAEVLTEGITGLLPPADNPDALAKAIEDLLSHSDKGKQLAAEAFRVVRERHDAPVHARKMADIYDNLIK